METLVKVILTVGLLSIIGLVIGMVGTMVTDFRSRVFEALMGWSIAVMMGGVVLFLLCAVASIWFK